MANNKTKAAKKRGPGRPWTGHTKVVRIARNVRFAPEDFQALERAAAKVGEGVEPFMKTAISERVRRVLKRSR